MLLERLLNLQLNIWTNYRVVAADNFCLKQVHLDLQIHHLYVAHIDVKVQSRLAQNDLRSTVQSARRDPYILVE